MTPEQIVAILATMSMLDPELIANFTKAQINSYVNMAYIIIEASGLKIPADKFTLAIAIKALSLLTTPENSNLSKKKIKDVEVTYFQGQGKSKWDSIFDSIINGDYGSDLTLNYVGI
ncbi:MAG: hypothetical protein ACRCX2_28360 [Paraclostridium sp.]